jgi:hypothetical protein
VCVCVCGEGEEERERRTEIQITVFFNRLQITSLFLNMSIIPQDLV